MTVSETEKQKSGDFDNKIHTHKRKGNEVCVQNEGFSHGCLKMNPIQKDLVEDRNHSQTGNDSHFILSKPQGEARCGRACL